MDEKVVDEFGQELKLDQHLILGYGDEEGGYLYEGTITKIEGNCITLTNDEGNDEYIGPANEVHIIDYECPRCGAGWRDEELYRHLQHNEDWVVQMKSIGSCPNCHPLEVL